MLHYTNAIYFTWRLIVYEKLKTIISPDSLVKAVWLPVIDDYRGFEESDF